MGCFEIDLFRYNVSENVYHEAIHCTAQLVTSLQIKSVFYVVFDLVFCFCKYELDEFLHSFASLTDDINQPNLRFVLITENFNGHCSSWWENGINNTEGYSYFILWLKAINMFTSSSFSYVKFIYWSYMY